MAKLYPPVISGTIPAFYGTSLDVPFSMNRAVGDKEFNNFVVKIKKINGELVGTIYADIEGVAQYLRENIVTFDLANIVNQLQIGEFYKLQLAYAQNKMPGIYSTVGVVKYTTKPEVVIEGLEKYSLNNHLYHYQGIYNQFESHNGKNIKDVSEKLYSSRFILYDNNNNIITDSGDILHNTMNDTVSYEATEPFFIANDLDVTKIYYLEYHTTSINGLQTQSPKYRLTQRRQSPMTAEVTIQAQMDNDSGAVQIYLKGNHKNKNVSGRFVLSRQVQGTNKWEELYRFALQREVPDCLLFSDYTVAQGVTYVYGLQQYNIDNVYSEYLLSNTVTVDFEDLFLYDGKRQLNIKFNPKVSSFKTTIVENKMDTIGSKYPFITRNGNIGYKELPISGLISYQMDDMELFLTKDQIGLESITHNLTANNIKAERDFKLAVLEWLNNGQPKLFRSPTEGNYIVRIMNVSLSPTDTVGRMLHTFSGTAYEIAEYNYDNLKTYSFIQQNDPIQYQMKWITQDLLLPQNDGSVKPLVGKVNQTVEFGTEIIHPVYHISVSGMVPGTYFQIGNNEDDLQTIFIGSTGSYELQLQEPYQYIIIPHRENNAADEENLQQLAGSITYGYRDEAVNIFDLLSDVKVVDVPCQQILGYSPVDIKTRLEDLKHKILNIHFLTFSTREYFPIYVKREEWNNTTEPLQNCTFYYEGNNAEYMQQQLMYDQPYQVKKVNLQQLNKWNLYKIYFLRENYDLLSLNGQDYYVDRVKEEKFTPFTGYYYDPYYPTQLLPEPEEDLTIATVTIKDAQNQTTYIQLDETQKLTIPSPNLQDQYFMGPGVVAYIGYQMEEPFYGTLEDKADLKKLYNDYQSCLSVYNNYIGMLSSTTLWENPIETIELDTITAYNEMINAYNVFLQELEKSIKIFKEVNGIEEFVS